jgi:tRNA threonylcarbamoyl adenosine modification protein (Sua5/YciO/YrdC/YwlC family)
MFPESKGKEVLLSKPRVLDIDAPEAGKAALEELRAQKCVVLPTDTVYGIAAALQPTAVKALLNAKGRGVDQPPPVVAANLEAAFSLATQVTPAARALAEAFWPGALTLVISTTAEFGNILGARGATVALRVPNHQGLLRVLETTGPLAMSSANLTSSPAAQNVAEAIEMLSKSVSLFLDGGQSAGNVPSTIVDVTDLKQIRVLRAGVIDTLALENALQGLEVSIA